MYIIGIICKGNLRISIIASELFLKEKMLDDLSIQNLVNRIWSFIKVSKSYISITVWRIKLKFCVWHTEGMSIVMVWKIFILFKILKIRLSYDVTFTTSFHVTSYWMTNFGKALERRTKWFLFRVSVLIRTKVMAKNMFRTFLVTLTLTFDLLRYKFGIWQRKLLVMYMSSMNKNEWKLWYKLVIEIYMNYVTFT